MLKLYTITIFLAAALLFLVQPMFAKLLAPLVGGAPAVWNTCMFFFQAALLAGYAYAHVTSTWLGARRQAVLHVAVVLGAIALLPVGLPHGWTPPSETNPAPWLVAVLAVSLGGPFFAASAASPLLQRWFAGTGHARAKDPYFLYVASNCGSLLALVAYPLVVEPSLTLTAQTWLWSGAYLLLAALTVACAVGVWRAERHGSREQGTGNREQSVEDKVQSVGDRAQGTGNRTKPTKRKMAVQSAARRTSASSAEVAAGPITAMRRLRWLALAFVPSSWLLGVTSYLTTDIAPMPLLWIVPLAIYLLTFMFAFARRPLVKPAWMARAFPPMMLLLTVSVIHLRGWPLVVLHLAAFFVGAMVCHGELAASRPGPTRLTEFYFWLSLGGVLGGMFNALVAPLIFPILLEYPLAVACAGLLLPRLRPTPYTARDSRIDMCLLAAALLYALLMRNVMMFTGSVLLAVMAICAVVVLVVLYALDRPRWFALVAGVVLVYSKQESPIPGHVLYTGRSFFGVHRVVAGPQDVFRILLHGTTVHGYQSPDPARRCVPLTYYHRTGPLGDVFAAQLKSPAPPETAVVGLGTGAAYCYAQRGQRFTFYEIDPLVQRIAEDPRYFTYLRDCGKGSYRIVLGDGRLNLSKARAHQYGLILLDAFSSDAIPLHLLTREALRTYRAALDARGILAFHVSNLHLDLVPVLGDLAGAEGLECLVCQDLFLSDELKAEGKTESVYVVMAPRPESLAHLRKARRWEAVHPRPGKAPWTDSFSNVISVLRW